MKSRTPAADLLRRAADLVKDGYYFSDIFEAATDQNVAREASDALNEYLKFPNVGWFDWQDRYSPKHVETTLRAAANAMESSPALKTPNTSPEDLEGDHADSDEITMLRRLVQLYQAGAVIEYHEFKPGKVDRCHVGFRYDAMSDDDYFETQELERRLKIEENANWRGDRAKLG